MLTEVYISTYQSDKAVRYIEFIESELLKDDKDSKDLETSKSKLSLFKARLSLLHGNVKACKRDIKNFSSLAGNVSVCPPPSPLSLSLSLSLSPCHTCICSNNSPKVGVSILTPCMADSLCPVLEGQHGVLVL